MKTLLVLGLLFFIIVGLYSFKKTNAITDSKGIQFFEGTFQEALQKAKDLNKPLFLDVYARWCGPCKLLKKTTFKDEEVGAYFNANFINIAVDGETPEGKELLKKYNIRAYPSLLILDNHGGVKTRATGYHKPKGLINFGKLVDP